MQYQLIQERYEPGFDGPTHDEYPFLFSTMEEVRERVKRDGLTAMFEHEGDNYFIAELQPYRNGVTFTGRQFNL